MTSNFEAEQEKLMEKVSLGLEQLISTLGDMNRNLETINAIGKEFEAPANVWHQFHKSVMVPDTATKQQLQPRQQLQQHDQDYDMLSNQAFAHGESHSVTSISHHSQQQQQQQQPK